MPPPLPASPPPTEAPPPTPVAPTPAPVAPTPDPVELIPEVILHVEPDTQEPEVSIETSKFYYRCPTVFYIYFTLYVVENTITILKKASTIFHVISCSSL